jgi:hypothetical protein
MRKMMIVLVIALMAGSVVAKSDFMEKFDKDYSNLSRDLLNHTGERAEVTDFVYKKDLATFTFSEGTMHLLRYVDDRPTTAVFIGRGHASITIPSRLERQALFTVARDSVVEEDFKSCLIRIGDDFDLALKEKFTFEPKELSWKHFNVASKKAQGEFFFKPTIVHTYDNYFQLLRSLYQRSSDGYFWIDFNRYVYTFDPSLPEQVTVAYEFQGGDMTVTDGAVLQREELGIYDDGEMSSLVYPTTMLDRQGRIHMEGADGKTIKQARIDLQILVNSDSLKFVSLFLHHTLKLDSLSMAGQPVDFHRRKDFSFIGVILPEYHMAGDTLALTLHYHGKRFENLVPWVENPQPTPISVEFAVPKGYDYFMPGMGAVKPGEGRTEVFQVAPGNPYDRFYFVCFPTGIDTVSQTSDIGLSVNFLDWSLLTKKVSDCFIPDEIYQSSVMSAFNFVAGQLGGPQGTFAVSVSAAGSHAMPGILIAPQIACVTEEPLASFGGYDILAGGAAAQQWFGALMRPATDRERWLTEAVSQYVGIMYLQSKFGSVAYANLLNRRDSIVNIVANKLDMPLACGSRASKVIRTNKGLWLIHMLRFMMYDLETGSEQTFRTFLQQLMIHSNGRTFGNADFVALAEKHCGQPLENFFSQWLYGINYPKYVGEYTITGSGSEYYVDLDIRVENAVEDFAMPVIMRVVGDGRASIFRETVAVPSTSLHLGPFDFEPTKLIFNEFYGVLSDDDVKQK